MQDELARKFEEPNVKPNDGYNIPHSKRIEKIRNTIDALLDIRLGLSVKKILSPTIKRNELREMVEKAKEKAKDLEVSNEIDKVFDEYLNVGEKSKDISNNNDSILKYEVESKIDKEINNKTLSLEEMKENLVEGSNQEKGKSKVLSNGHYGNSSSDIASAWQ